MLERQLPNLDLIELIGLGGAAEVYRAVDADGRHVAVKILSERADDEMVRRFLREGRTLSRLDHPHIVAVDRMGEFHGSRFLVMELIEGGSLKERLVGGSLPWREAVSIALQLVQALGHAHEHGIVHRDVKPGNVMFTRDGTAKLADFGLAHISDVSAMTRTGTIMGTVFYLAPEQCLGREIDGRTDLYAIGALLYEMLSGQPPFTGPSAVSIIYKHLNEQPPDLRGTCPAVPPPLAAIVERLLQKDPAQRFPDAQTVADALAALLELPDGAPALEASSTDLLGRPLVTTSLGFLGGEADPALVGREEILAAIDGALASAVAGRGSLLLLSGEAGTGKSRLLREAARRAAEKNTLALYGECFYADGPDPYAALVAMLRGFQQAGGLAGLAHPGQDGDDGNSTLANLAADLYALLGMGTPSDGQRDRAQWLQDASPRDAQAQLFELVVQFFDALSRQRPLLLLIDDLHWASETFARLLHYLARSLRRSRVTILGSYRPEDVVEAVEEAAPLRDTLRRMSREHLFAEHTVTALPAELTATLVADVLWPSGELGAEDMPPGFVQILQQDSEGNPFHLLEMLRLLADEERVLWAEDHWELSDELWQQAQERQAESPRLDPLRRSIQIPTSVLELVMRRVDLLERDQRELLEWAAVLSPTVDIEVLAAVTGQRRLSVLRDMHALERDHGLLDASEQGFAFQHATIPQAIYGDLPPSLREEYHLMVAEAIKECYGDDAHDWIYALARHYGHTNETAQAYHYARRAADMAEETYAVTEAMAYLDRALTLLQELSPDEDAQPDPDRIREEALLEQRVGRLRLTVGDIGGASESLGNVLAAGEALDDAALQCTALLDLAIGSCRSGDWPAAIALGERSLACAERADRLAPPEPLTPQVLLSAGFFAFESGDWDGARARLDSALECLDVDNRAVPDIGRSAAMLRARAYGNLGILHDAQGDHEQAAAHFADAAATFASLDLPLDEARALNNLGYARYRTRRLDEATLHYQRALELFTKVGDVREQAVAHLHLAECALARVQDGDATARDDARTHCAQATQRFQRVGFELGLADVDRVYAGLARTEGRWAVAERYLQDALQVYGAHGDQLNIAETQEELARLYADMGAEGRAREALDQSRTLFGVLRGDAVGDEPKRPDGEG